MRADDDMISMVIIIIITIIIIMFIIIILMMVMRMMTMMEIMMLEAPICKHVLQILDMTIPIPTFGKNPDQLLLQDTIESDPPGAPI